MNKLFLLLTVFVSMPAFSYIGPGMSGGLIIAVIGFFTAIILGIWGILYFPIKRSLKKIKEKKLVSKSHKNDIE